MSQFNNLYYAGTKYNPGALLMSGVEPVTTVLTDDNKLKFSSSSGLNHHGILLTSKETVSIKNGYSLTFDLGNTFYHNDQHGDDGMICFSFYNNQVNDNSDYESFIPDEMEGCRYSGTEETGYEYARKLFYVDEDNEDYFDNYGFSLAFFYDPADDSSDPVIKRFQLVVKRKEYNGLVENALVDTYSKTICYSGELPCPIDFSRPCTLSLIRNDDMIKLFINGIWITEFFIGGDEDVTAFDGDLYLTIYSVGATTSTAEINLHSVNGISAATYFSIYREYLEILSKLTSDTEISLLSEAEVTKLQYLADNCRDSEAYFLNEGLILKVLDRYEREEVE